MKKKIIFLIAVLLVPLSYVGKHVFFAVRQSLSETFFDEHQCSDSTSLHKEHVAEVPSSTGVTLVFDLHGVLLDVDAKKAFSEIGLSSILKYSSARNISFSAIEHELTAKVYEILNAIQPTGSDSEVLDPSGNCMPALMYDWQRGHKSNSELRSIVVAALDDHPEWFTSDIEKQLVYQIMIKMFTPEQLVSTVKIVPEGLAFVKKCKKQGHTLMVLSNWDAESFTCLRQKFPDFFALFDGIVISGETHRVKPKREAFEFLVTRKKEYNEDIIFIDDQQENVDAATAVGLHGVVCKAKADFLGFTSTPDISSVKKEVAQIIAQRS